jgi:hypothetical protein
MLDASFLDADELAMQSDVVYRFDDIAASVDNLLVNLDSVQSGSGCQT